MNGMGAHQSSRSQTSIWLTPPEITAALGAFDLDPCAAPGPRPWDTAAACYAEGGLELPWFGRVWLNPPYGPPTVIDPWMDRLAAYGRGTAMIFARTETKMFFRAVWGAASGVLFIRNRIHFHHADGRRARANGGAPSVLVAYGADDLERLADSGIGGHLVPLRFPSSVVVLALASTWSEAVAAWARGQSGPILVEDLYRAFASHPKARGRQHWREKVRQTLQRGPFRRVRRGEWELVG